MKQELQMAMEPDKWHRVAVQIRPDQRAAAYDLIKKKRVRSISELVRQGLDDKIKELNGR